MQITEEQGKKKSLPKWLKLRRQKLQSNEIYVVLHIPYVARRDDCNPPPYSCRVPPHDAFAPPDPRSETTEADPPAGSSETGLLRGFSSLPQPTEMLIWDTQGQELCLTMLSSSSVPLNACCDPWLGTVGYNYWGSFLERNFISAKYWPDSALKSQR